MTLVFLADDHPLVLSGIEAVLKNTRYRVLGKARDGTELLSLLATAQPDLLIMDIKMPGHTGIEVLRTLRNKKNQTPVILLTADLQDDALSEALELDVNGIILKEGAETLLIACLDTVSKGGRWIDADIVKRVLEVTSKDYGDRRPLSKLSVRERGIAELVAQSLRNRDIAAELALTEGTVRVSLHRIYEKLGIENRTELAMLVRDARDDLITRK